MMNLKQIRAGRKARGLCINCSAPITNGKVACNRCSERATKCTMKRHNARKRAHECIGCGVKLQDKENYRCKICNNIYRIRSQEKWHRQHKIVIDHYGGKCECCGETHYEFLEVDHINRDGKQHRNKVGRHMMSWIIRNKFPKDLRLLCANCNRGTGHYNVCPHHLEPEKPTSKSGRKFRNRRKRVIEFYGSKCKCCGENNWAFLEFDHINNDGGIQRKKGIKMTAKWIIKNKYPKYLQLLCGNCNKAKGLYKYCPHNPNQKYI